MGTLHPSVAKHRRSNLAPSGEWPPPGDFVPHKTNWIRTLRLDERARRILAILKLILRKRPLRVCEVARELRVSPSHLQHFFKRETGVSLGHLLTEQKLQRAVYLLMHSDMRIKDIASSVGYVHAPSFIRAFERRFGEPPDFYRRRRSAIS